MFRVLQKGKRTNLRAIFNSADLIKPLSENVDENLKNFDARLTDLRSRTFIVSND